MSNSETNDTPLAQVSATSLNELFNKDPRTLEDGEIITIISALRKDRERWIVEDKIEKTKKASPAAKTAKVAAAASLKLDDLDL